MNTDHNINSGAVDATDFEMADALMQAMADTGFAGMSAHQRNIACKLAEMLDAAVRRLNAIQAMAGKDAGLLITLASNHALMMRKHGTTLRGAKGAWLLEDLCDAVLAAKKSAPFLMDGQEIQAPVAIPSPDSQGCITVDQAMDVTGAKTKTQLAKIAGVTPQTITNWTNQGFIGWKHSILIVDMAKVAA